MVESIRELAQEIHRTRPNATIPVILELKNFTQKNINALVSRGFKIRTVIKELKMLTGEVPADPKTTEEIQSLDFIQTLSVSCELDTL